MPCKPGEKPKNFFKKPTRKIFKQFRLGGTEDLSDWKRRFIETLDPTEYAGAMELVGSWDEWLRFKRHWPAFNGIVESWLEEMEIRLRSMAIKAMLSQSKTDKGTQAAKWIAEGGYRPKQAGRPSKAAIQKEARVQAGVSTEVDDDISRVLGPNKDKVLYN